MSWMPRDSTNAVAAGFGHGGGAGKQAGEDLGRKLSRVRSARVVVRSVAFVVFNGHVEGSCDASILFFCVKQCSHNPSVASECST